MIEGGNGEAFDIVKGVFEANDGQQQDPVVGNSVAIPSLSDDEVAILKGSRQRRPDEAEEAVKAGQKALDARAKEDEEDEEDEESLPQLPLFTQADKDQLRLTWTGEQHADEIVVSWTSHFPLSKTLTSLQRSVTDKYLALSARFEAQQRLPPLLRDRECLREVYSAFKKYGVNSMEEVIAQNERDRAPSPLHDADFRQAANDTLEGMGFKGVQDLDALEVYIVTEATGLGITYEQLAAGPKKTLKQAKEALYKPMLAELVKGVKAGKWTVQK